MKVVKPAIRNTALRVKAYKNLRRKGLKWPKQETAFSYLP